MSEILHQLGVLLILAIVNGAFAMAELSLIYARRSKLTLEASEGSRRASVALELLESPNAFLSTTQTGVTLISILAGVYGGAELSARLSKSLLALGFSAQVSYVASYILVVVGITYLSLVLGELVPKRLALAFPEAIAKFVGPSVRFLSWIFFPVVRLLDVSTEFILRLLPLKLTQAPQVTEEEIKHLIEEGTAAGAIEQSEEDILHKVFRLGDRSVASLMTPRADITWVDVNDPPQAIWTEAQSSGHSYFPVGDGDIENPIGVLAIRDLANCLINPGTVGLRDLIVEPLQVPSTTTALKLVDRFKESGKQIAIVIDEHGGVDGLITTHDLMEALVGDIGDEGDDPKIVKRHDGSWLVDATIDIVELMDTLEIAYDHAEVQRDYHSLGGFVTGQLGHIPSIAESFIFEGFRFEVVDMDRNRIDKVMIARHILSSGD